MKAVVQRRYGAPEGLVVEDVALPVVKDDEVLVRVRATSVHPDVWHVVTGRPYVLRLMGSGLRRPRRQVPGTDVAGHVEAVGPDVTGLRPGDEVFGETVRRMEWRNGGAFAEYVAAPAFALALKPATLTFEQAAAIPTSAFIALQVVRDQGQIKAGQRVLVNGAGGGVGTFAVQLAKAAGAEVTAVDSAHKLALLRSLGADRVVDYATQDFTRTGDRYDVILDVAGTCSPTDARRALVPTGRYVLVGHDHFGRSGSRWFGSLGRFARLFVLSAFSPQLRVPLSIDKENRLVVLTELVDSGQLTAVVDRTFPLSEVVAALRYLETGQPAGKVVLTV